MPAPREALKMASTPFPELEPGGMLLEVHFAEVCGTDVHLHHGRLSGVPYPLVPGHVSVGTIAEINGTVADIYGVPFQKGELITFLDVHETCGSCWHCLVGKNSTRCPSRKVYGITYGQNDGPLGGWAEYVYLKPGVKAIRLPAGLHPETFIGGGCGAPTAFHAVERAGIRMNDTVVIQGTGPVGLSAIAFARIRGAGQIIAIGAPQDRCFLALAMGADQALNIEVTPEARRRDIIESITHSRGADVVIEATGNPAAIVEGMQLTRDAGTYVVVGQYTDNGEASINPHLHLNRKHLNMLGCWGSDFSHFFGAVETMARCQKTVPWAEMAKWTYKLAEAGKALQDIEERRVPKAVLHVKQKV